MGIIPLTQCDQVDFVMEAFRIGAVFASNKLVMHSSAADEESKYRLPQLN